MAKTIPMGPRLELLFGEVGDKIDNVPASARRELNDLLVYVEGQEMIYKLVAFFINAVPMPECVVEEQAEVAETGRPEPDTTLVMLDDERDEDEADDEPEIDPDDGVEETIPTDPPPKRSQVRPDPKRRSWKKPAKKSDPPSPEVQG